MSATEDTVKDVIGNLKTGQQKTSHTKYEKPISKYSEKDMALNKLSSLDKSRSYSRTEKEDTVTPETKTRLILSSSLDDKNIKEQQLK